MPECAFEEDRKTEEDGLMACAAHCGCYLQKKQAAGFSPQSGARFKPVKKLDFGPASRWEGLGLVKNLWTCHKVSSKA